MSKTRMSTSPVPLSPSSAAVEVNSDPEAREARVGTDSKLSLQTVCYKTTQKFYVT